MTGWDDPSRLQTVLDSLGGVPPHRPAELLFQWQRLARLRPSVFIEVGSRHGLGLRCWAEACAEDALVIAVDWPNQGWGAEGSLDLLRKNLRVIQDGGRDIGLILGDSHSKEVQQEVMCMLDGRPVDAVHIDGDHTYRGSKLDWEFFSPLVRPGGLVMLHDVHPVQKNEHIQVHRVFSEIEQTHRTESLMLYETNCGAGVVWIDGV